jgi:hypothetical protein
MKLIDLKEILDKDDFTTAYFEKSDKLPFDRLNVILPTKEKDKLVLELLFTPGMDEILKGFRLFQYFVRLPFEIDPDTKEAMKSFILKMNMGLPMMGFGFNEEDNYIFFKSINMIPNKDDISEDLKSVVVENVYMISFIMNRFYQLIKDLAKGKIHLAKALKKLV